MKDEHGYPTDEAIDLIESFDIIKEGQSSFWDLIEECWWMAERQMERKENEIVLHTGGWSGNEEIIQAMKNSKYFLWGVFWVQSKRGGHYWFEINKNFKL